MKYKNQNPESSIGENESGSISKAVLLYFNFLHLLITVHNFEPCIIPL